MKTASMGRGQRALLFALALPMALSPLQGGTYTSDLSGNLLAQAAGALATPVILGQPQQQVVEPGKTASFSVTLADEQGATYQWKFNGNPISGATSDSLVLTSVSAANEGLYSVFVSNGSGNATSNSVHLYIDSDGDGMADSWEIANFGNLNQTATGDFDNDGVSNLDEFRDGTNPNNASSFNTRLTVITDGGGTVTVSPVKATYNQGDVVTLTATPYAPSTFHGWTGDLTGATNPATLTMSANRTVYAHFLSTSLPPGAISWWKAESDAQDSMGLNNGALINGTSFVAGKVGQAFSFNGTNQSVDVPDSPSLRPASLTLEAWVNLNSFSGTRLIFAKPVGSGAADSYAVWVNNGTLEAEISGGPVLAASFAPAPGEWHHVAYTFDDTTKLQTLYIDGKPVANGGNAGSISYDTQPFLLGRDIENGVANYFFSGAIDEATIYNRALTADEIIAIYTADISGKAIPQPYFTSPLQFPDAAVATAYSYQLTALGINPLGYVFAEGNTPPGLTLSTSGLISGTPTVGGVYSFSIRVTDGNGGSTEQYVALNVFGQIAPPPGLISWWRAENNAQDSIGTNHGSLINGTTFVPGRVGNAFSFNGTSQSVDVPDSASLHPASLTLEAWINMSSLSGSRIVFAKPLGSGSLDSCALWVSSGVLNGGIASNAGFGPVLTATFAPALGTWHHVAYTFDDTTKIETLYIDGIAVSSSNTGRSISYDSSAFLIGRDSDSGSPDSYFAGSIDEASIYNRALGSDEVAAVFGSGAAGKTTAGLYFNTTPSLPNGFVNQVYNQTITALRGTAPTTYSVIGGALPPGLALGGAGVISGTPAAAGTFTFTIRATDAVSLHVDQTFTLSVFAPVAPAAGLVSWWRAENDATDALGLNNGTLNNGVSFAAGEAGQSFALSGASQYVSASDSPSLRPASVTLEAWINFAVAPLGVESVCGKAVGGSVADSYAIYWYSGSIYGSIGDINGNYFGVGAAFAPTPGQWYHVAFTFDDTTKVEQLYINGAVVASGPANVSLGYDTHPFFIGADFDTGATTYFFNGRIDEAAIYNRALSSTEIASISNAGPAGRTLTGPYFASAPSLPNAVAYTPYSYTVTSARGTGQVNNSILNGALPPGITLATNGLLSGTTGSVGQFTFTIRATDANNVSADQTFTLTVSPRISPAPGIISWWRAENNANDSIGPNNGTLMNGTTFAAGKVGNSFSFDGVDDSVSIPSINAGSQFTVECWVFPTQPTGTYQHLISNDYQSSGYGALYYKGSHIEYWQSGAVKLSSLDGSVPSFTWSHIALTYANGFDLLYINGVLVASSGSHTETFNNSVMFGYTNVASDQHFKGLLDEIAVYNRGLSGGEIAGIYNAGSTGKTISGPYINVVPTLPDATVAVAYSQSITSLRGTGSITYSLLTGSLPSGITLNPAGLLSGTPTAAADYGFVVRATDANGLFGDQTFTLHVALRSRVASGIVSWWRAENNALDVFSTNNGTLNNGATFAAGKVGQAFSFDGIDDSVTANDSVSLRCTSFTLEGWVMFNASSGIQFIFSKSLGGSLNSYALFLQSGQLSAAVGDATSEGPVLRYNFSPLPGVWYHIAYTFDASIKQQILYVNTAIVAIGIGDRAPAYDTHPFTLGAYNPVGGPFYLLNGRIDEATIYNRALSGAELAGIYSAGAAGKRVFYPYETWKLINLGDADASSTANPDGDALNNLLEYAFNSNPNSNASSNVPTVSIDATNISVTYNKVLAATDLTYTIEQSTDLASWQTALPTNSIQSDNGIVQVIKASVPRANAGAGGKLFLRVRVTVSNN